MQRRTQYPTKQPDRTPNEVKALLHAYRPTVHRHRAQTPHLAPVVLQCTRHQLWKPALTVRSERVKSPQHAYTTRMGAQTPCTDTAPRTCSLAVHQTPAVEASVNRKIRASKIATTRIHNEKCRTHPPARTRAGAIMWALMGAWALKMQSETSNEEVVAG